MNWHDQQEEERIKRWHEEMIEDMLKVLYLDSLYLQKEMLEESKYEAFQIEREKEKHKDLKKTWIGKLYNKKIDLYHRSKCGDPVCEYYEMHMAHCKFNVANEDEVTNSSVIKLKKKETIATNDMKKLMKKLGKRNRTSNKKKHGKYKREIIDCSIY